MASSGSKRIAERYVTALFDVAREAQALNAVESDLQAVSRALAQSEDFQHFLVNPLVPPDHQADALVEIATKMQLHALSRQFLAMLAREKRLALLPEVIAEFAEAAAAARGELRAQLMAAAPLTAQELASVKERLGRAYGKTITLDVSENPALLGGIIIKIGGTQLDASLSGKLDRLGMQLKAA